MNNYIRVLEYLNKYAGDTKKHSMEELLPELSKKEKAQIFSELQHEGLIEFSGGHSNHDAIISIGYHDGRPMTYIKPDKFEYFPFVGKITFKGINYLSDEKQKADKGINISANNNSNVNVIHNSPYAVLNEANQIITSIMSAIETDTNLNAQSKNEIKSTINQLREEIKNSKPTETTFSRLLRQTANVASIGSFITNLIKVLNPV